MRDSLRWRSGQLSGADDLRSGRVAGELGRAKRRMRVISKPAAVMASAVWREPWQPAPMRGQRWRRGFVG